MHPIPSEHRGRWRIANDRSLNVERWMRNKLRQCGILSFELMGCLAVGNARMTRKDDLHWTLQHVFVVLHSVRPLSLSIHILRPTIFGKSMSYPASTPAVEGMAVHWLSFPASIVLSSLSFNMEHEQANNNRVEKPRQTPKKSFCSPATGGDDLSQEALPLNSGRIVRLQPLGVNATSSSHASNREGRRNSSESGNRSEETTAKVWAESTKGWMLCCEWSNSSSIWL